jgi:hypothetical protein
MSTAILDTFNITTTSGLLVELAENGLAHAISLKTGERFELEEKFISFMKGGDSGAYVFRPSLAEAPT